MLTTQELVGLSGVGLAALALFRQILRDRRDAPKVSVVLDETWTDLRGESGKRAVTMTVFNNGGREAVITDARVACLDGSLRQHVLKCTHVVVTETGVTGRNEGEFMPQLIVPGYRCQRRRFATSDYANLAVYRAKVVIQEGSEHFARQNRAMLFNRLSSFVRKVFSRTPGPPAMHGPRPFFLAYSMRSASARLYRGMMWFMPVSCAIALATSKFGLLAFAETIALTLVLMWLFRKLALVFEARNDAPL